MRTSYPKGRKLSAGNWHSKGGGNEDLCVGRGLFGSSPCIAKEKGMVRSVDLARHMGFSKPSISHAVGVLKNGGFLTVDEDGYLHLTEDGREVAEKIYERHQFFTEQLVAVGVDRETAERDACRIEHAISEETFQKLKASVEKQSNDTA